MSPGDVIQKAADPQASDPAISDAIARYWGFDTLRPMQREAIAAGLAQRDSLVVLPTGGGKSLCYQAPPLVADRLDVVVSPLISLMRDQVDALRQIGYPAAAVHSNLSPAERDEVREGMRAGRYRLLFISPERLMSQRFLSYLQRVGVTTFAIDEAHCISQWGHDFRKEYRMLASLKLHFPGASMHAYTATATPRVREDIVAQLGLRDPTVLVGTFDRPNLTYRIVPSVDVFSQTLDAVRRHENEAAIVYCLSRNDTEEMAAYLKSAGVKAAAYHAGLERDERTMVQDAFSREELDVVAATVAFGMGIDRSNVRCIAHASMPKSIEHYQQETGRAGRDGLPAECVLFYSGADALRWDRLIAFSAEKADDPEPVIAAGTELLRHMQGLCGTLECRHRAISRYFGQEYPEENCGACDVCLGEVEPMPNSTEIAQKILSCVYRIGQRFGVGHVVSVLRGGNTDMIRKHGHDQLSTYGLLESRAEKTLTNLVYQLIDQGLLTRTPGDRPVVQLGPEAGEVLRGDREVKLLSPHRGIVHDRAATADEWSEHEEQLFQHLRAVRKRLADEREMPAFVIFSDVTLRGLAKHRPSTLDQLSRIEGVGRKKLTDFGDLLLEEIASHCDRHELDHRARPAPKKKGKPNPVRVQAIEMLRNGCSIDEVVTETGRAASTVWKYLAQLIEDDPPESLKAWVDAATQQRVLDVAKTMSEERLKPMYEALDEEVPYDVIRVVLAYAALR